MGETDVMSPDWPIVGKKELDKSLKYHTSMGTDVRLKDDLNLTPESRLVLKHLIENAAEGLKENSAKQAASEALMPVDELRLATQGFTTHDENPEPQSNKSSQLKQDILEHMQKSDASSKLNKGLSSSADSVEPVEKIRQVQVDQILGMAATSIAKDTDSNCLISIEKKKGVNNNGDFFDAHVSIFKRETKKGKWGRYEYQTKMKKASHGSSISMKEVLLEAIRKKYIVEGDRAVCIEDGSLSTGYKGMLLLFDIDKTLFNISMAHISDKFNADVVEAVMKIAEEISGQGREGKKVGTAFIIGDRSDLAKYTQQLILNPFTGYPEDMRKVTDPNMKETIKNYALLDGVFLIDEDGTLLSAGAYINVDSNDIDLPGFGTRHRCAAAITKKCNSLAIVVSESGGTIRVFKDGKVQMTV